jgi:asparaginyl-tRNA synthetase
MTKIADVLVGGLEGQDVELRGWVYRHRSSGGIVFLVLRDSTGILQVTVNKADVDAAVFSAAETTGVEASVVVRGAVVADRRAPGGLEVKAQDYRVVGPSVNFPIARDLSEEFLLDIRHLHIRSPRIANILRVRSTVEGAIHEYFREKGFLEVDPPIITPAGSEGGATLFALDYFGRRAYLSQSWQLYAEAMVMALEKIYCVAPSFRAEKSRTSRHLTEYWHAEMEEAWVGMEEVLRHGEGLLAHICGVVADINIRELESLKRDREALRRVKPPFPRITYEEALKKLEKVGIQVEWGKDIRTLEEEALAKMYDNPLVITHFPREGQAFYKRADPGNPDVVLGFDFIAPEIGSELIGGSEREPDLEELRKNLLRQGEDPKAYEWYLDSRRYGSVPHSGFGMGVDRVVRWVTLADHIRDTIPFPRTPARYYP